MARSLAGAAPALPAATCQALVRGLRAILGPQYVLWRPDQLAAYQYDGSADRGVPDVVALPASTDQVVQCVRLAAELGVPVVPRGAGTGLSAGAVPARGGLVLCLARLKRILEVDPQNLRAVVEPGLVNLDLSQAVAPLGLYYAPDPSSQGACTIGGNVAENAGGPHCLAYGVTTNHVLGLEVVLSDGQVVSLGGKCPDRPGYDLTGLFVGSEGTFGIVTRVVVRLLPLPEAVRTFLAVFPRMSDASRCTSAIIAAGIIPAALEMMDGVTIRALQLAGHQGLPSGVEAVLLVELEGLTEGVEELAQRVRDLCLEHHAQEVRAAASAAERTALWKARKGALGALGQIKPNYYLQDGTVPRTRLPEVLETVQEVSARYGLPIANVFHAGDGNLHPCLLFDERLPGETEKVIAASAEILRRCVELGGTLSGEHGVGIEKQPYLPWLFGSADLAAMQAARRAFDPAGRLNPGKIFPPDGARAGEG